MAIPGVAAAVLVPIAGEVLCPVVPDHHHCQCHSVEDDEEDGGGEEDDVDKANLNCG